MAVTLEQVDDGGSGLELLARGILSQLSVLFGSRGTGKVLVKATGDDMLLTPNSYGAPIITTASGPGERPDMLVKTAFNPATEEPHKQGGDWLITAAGTEVDLVTAIGSTQSAAIVAGSSIRWDPPLEGIEATSLVTQGFAGADGAGPAKYGTVFEELENGARSLLDAQLPAFPALVVAWLGSEPVEGRTAGISQGATLKSRKSKTYFETFGVYVVSSSAEGRGRRKMAQRLLEGASQLLTDRSSNDDGEVLCTMGTGLYVLNRTPRIAQSANASVGRVLLRTISTLSRAEGRTFRPWLTTSFGASLPASTDPDAPVEQQSPLPILPAESILANMPQPEDEDP
jgi:hypothetical protein